MATEKRRSATSRSYSERKIPHRSIPREPRQSVGQEERQENDQASQEKASYAQILEGVYELNEHELETIISAAKYALQQKQEQGSRGEEIEIKPFYDSLIQVVKELGTTVYKPQSYHVFLSQQSGRRIKRIARDKAQVDNWISKHVGKLRRTEQFAFYRFAWICLLNWLNKHNESRGPKTALNYASYIPEAIDAELPGYVQSGVLKRIIRKHTEERKSKQEDIE